MLIIHPLYVAGVMMLAEFATIRLGWKTPVQASYLYVACSGIIIGLTGCAIYNRADRKKKKNIMH